jgi:hypothetical protein
MLLILLWERLLWFSMQMAILSSIREELGEENPALQ